MLLMKKLHSTVQNVLNDHQLETPMKQTMSQVNAHQLIEGNSPIRGFPNCDDLNSLRSGRSADLRLVDGFARRSSESGSINDKPVGEVAQNTQVRNTRGSEEESEIGMTSKILPLKAKNLDKVSDLQH